MILSLTLEGVPGVRAAMLAFKGGAFQAEYFGGALEASQRVVRDKARTRNFQFTDRTGRLRSSIHSARITARYAGRRYKRGRAGTFAGGYLRGGAEPRLARHSQLVERGHDKSRDGRGVVARARPFLRLSLFTTIARQNVEFAANARRRFPVLVDRYVRREARRAARRKVVVRGSLGSLDAYSTLVQRRGLGARRGAFRL